MCILNCNSSSNLLINLNAYEVKIYIYDFHIEKNPVGMRHFWGTPYVNRSPLGEGGFPVKIGWSERPRMCPEAFLSSYATVPECRHHENSFQNWSYCCEATKVYFCCAAARARRLTHAWTNPSSTIVLALPRVCLFPSWKILSELFWLQ